MREYSIEDGKTMVQAARSAIELYIRNPKFDKSMVEKELSKFRQRHGVFVTLYYHPSEQLRGCVGFPRPVNAVSHDLVEAALAAAFEDPRFVPMSTNELDDTAIEVSILSDPVPLKGSAMTRLKNVVVGRDGLIVEYGVYSGLLLPIVAVEQHWDAERFLREVCVKAGLPETYWTQANVNLYKYETQVFREEKPNGEIIEVKF
ncbi:MAG: TIGR00296 family protein [Candidatus Marsarchaeota archaeon]|jgi:uncharacterized protein (TIGR00296 family)|nr:TIGR00296 family protein [Candidatus Marsarchaeota archaeon]